jgi:hypothetical protein
LFAHSCSYNCLEISNAFCLNPFPVSFLFFFGLENNGASTSDFVNMKFARLTNWEKRLPIPAGSTVGWSFCFFTPL